MHSFYCQHASAVFVKRKSQLRRKCFQRHKNREYQKKEGGRKTKKRAKNKAETFWTSPLSAMIVTYFILHIYLQLQHLSHSKYAELLLHSYEPSCVSGENRLQCLGPQQKYVHTLLVYFYSIFHLLVYSSGRLMLSNQQKLRSQR